MLSGSRRREIWVAGYPSPYGGADTELDHQIDLWLAHGVRVNLVPNGPPDPGMLQSVTARGAVTHSYRPDIFTGKVVVSYCNGLFLSRLPEIARAGRPRCVVWVNCMTWTFPMELECHRLGLIDLFAFQSRYQRAWLVPELNSVRPVNELEGYRPYFSLTSWRGSRPWSGRFPLDVGYYGIGRISRDDEAKFPADLWETFARVRAPMPLKCFVLGWGRNAERKCALPPNSGLDWLLWPPAAIPAPSFYSRIHTLIHQTGGSRENWPRVAFEAAASGVVILAERDFAWPELVENHVTGILCRTSDEFASYASELAFDESWRQRLATSALRRLLAEHCNLRAAFTPWAEIL